MDEEEREHYEEEFAQEAAELAQEAAEMQLEDGVILGSRDRTMKNITIRGIDAEVYDDFSKKIKSIDMNIGNAISRMMKDILSDFDETFPAISAKTVRRMKKLDINHHGDLHISKEDLEEADAKINFNHIRNLEFAPDITKEIFETYVGGIYHCTHIRMPKVLPRLVLFSKVHFCKDLEFYEVESDK
ncbi:MAG: hypothetical protein ACXAD7_05295 [Candidatus Kariarchaeaceae archaeon]|jgi:hypothetical protein